MFFWKHYFYSVFSKTQLFKSKNGMLKKSKIMKNSGLFLNMAKWCFLFFFEVLMLLWFVFGVFGIVPEVLKMLVFFFPVFWAFVGWFILVYFGFGRFRCFCVSCVCFCFFVLLLFLFCLLCFCFVVGLFLVLVLVLLLFLFIFFFFCFCVLVFFVFVFVLVFVFCFFLEGLRVRWGGPKGHLTWP